MLAPLRDNPSRRAVVRSATIAAPVEGWDASSPLAAMKPLRAIELRNWFPQPGYVEVRRGFQQHAVDLGTTSTPVETLMAWNGPASSKMFGAAGGVIYDTTVAGVATSSVTSLSEDRWQWCNMTTSAGAFLVIANGTDDVRNYNGTVWSTPSITGVSSSDLIYPCVHKKRLWFVQEGTTDAWYLGTEAISGAATKFSLGANFDLGGHLVAMGTWTLDGGSGPDDCAVFVSSKGQVAVYQGTDPSSASTWALIGVFNQAAPIGRRCLVKYGESPLLVTNAGVLQLSMSLKSEKANLTATALTARIMNAVNIAARSYSSLFGWELCVYPKGTRLILNIPTAENSTAKQYVMNTLTGAWCEFDNHDANCLLVYGDELYFGGNDGRVYKADTSSADVATAITAVGQTAYQALFSAGNIKRLSMVQPLVTSTGDARPSVGVSVDFRETSTLSTPSAAVAESSLWDDAVWDTDVWGGAGAFVSDWTSTPALGRFSSVKFQASIGSTAEVSLWGTSLWGQDGWGSSNISDEPMQINGFVVLAEVGGFI